MGGLGRLQAMRLVLLGRMARDARLLPLADNSGCTPVAAFKSQLVRLQMACRH